MTEETARALIQAHFDASGIGVPGGGPEDDIARASEIYADDAVVEWPQGGERVRGKANIIAFRSTYPVRQRFEVHRITGCHDLWVNEYTIHYDDRPVMAVGIMEFRDEKVSVTGSTSATHGSRRRGAPNGSSGSIRAGDAGLSVKAGSGRRGSLGAGPSVRLGPRGRTTRRRATMVPPWSSGRPSTSLR
jgi:hypothetical protein